MGCDAGTGTADNDAGVCTSGTGSAGGSAVGSSRNPMPRWSCTGLTAGAGAVPSYPAPAPAGMAAPGSGDGSRSGCPIDGWATEGWG